MDIRQLRYFSTIFECRSLSAAADRERVAVSALSYHLTNLEEEIGVPLFTRKARGLESTAAGERLYLHAQSILRALELARNDLSTFRATVEGEISVAIAYSAVRAIGVDLARHVVDHFPKLRLNLIESLSSTSVLHLAASHADLVLAYNPPAAPGMRSSPILDEDLVLIGPRAVIGDTDAPATLDEILGLRVILLRQGVAARALLDSHEIVQKLYTSSQLQMNSVHAIAGALNAGLGCTIGTTLFMEEHIQSGRLHWRPITSPKLTRTLFLCEQTVHPPTVALETVRDLILRLVAEAVTRGRWPARLVDPPPAG